MFQSPNNFGSSFNNESFGFNTNNNTITSSDPLYILYKKIKDDRIIIGYMKSVEDIVKRITGMQMTELENVQHLEFDKVNSKSNKAETFILTCNGYIGKSGQVVQLSNMTNNYCQITAKLELRENWRILYNDINSKINMDNLNGQKMTSYNNLFSNIKNYRL